MATKPEHHDAGARLRQESEAPDEAFAAGAGNPGRRSPTSSRSPRRRSPRSAAWNPAACISTLLDRKLIITAGRKQVIGRPILYKTSKEFLLRFGLKDVSELPSLEEFEKPAWRRSFPRQRRRSIAGTATGDGSPRAASLPRNRKRHPASSGQPCHPERGLLAGVGDSCISFQSDRHARPPAPSRSTMYHQNWYAQERLQKIIAAAGIASRRKAEELITSGLVSVNGEVASELGSKADPAKDEIRIDGQILGGPERSSTFF